MANTECDTCVIKLMVIYAHKQTTKQSFLGGKKKMAIGEIIICSTVDEVIRKAFELHNEGIKTEFVTNCTLKVVDINKNC